MTEIDEATLANDVYRKIFESRRDHHLLGSSRFHTELNIDDLYPLPTLENK